MPEGYESLNKSGSNSNERVPKFEAKLTGVENLNSVEIEVIPKETGSVRVFTRGSVTNHPGDNTEFVAENVIPDKPLKVMLKTSGFSSFDDVDATIFFYKENNGDVLDQVTIRLKDAIRSSTENY